MIHIVIHNTLRIAKFDNSVYISHYHEGAFNIYDIN